MDRRIYHRMGGDHHLGLRSLARGRASLERFFLYDDDLSRRRLRPSIPALASPGVIPGASFPFILGAFDKFRLRFLGALCFLSHNPPFLVIPAHPR
jgi:hypothetical protein